MPSTPLPVASRSHGRVAGAYAQPLLDLAQDHGVDLRVLAHDAGLAPDALAPLPETLDAGAYVRLLDAGAKLTQDAHFGLHVGERVKLGTYSVYGLILLSCRDFGQVLQQTLRYESLAHDLGRSSLEVADGLATYRWHSHFEDASRHLVESVFAGVRVFGNWLAGQPLPPAAVTFTHTVPADVREYQRIFGSEVVFDAADNCARFDAGLLQLPVPNADVTLYPVLQRHAEQLLQDRQRTRHTPATVAQVRARIAHRLAQDGARLPGVAEDLGLTARTLQRKLHEAGVGFQQLLEQTRHELALDYLRQRHLSLVDVAFLLGYQDQSAFSHAFKEWTGKSPGSYREQETTLQI